MTQTTAQVSSKKASKIQTKAIRIVLIREGQLTHTATKKS